MDAAPAFQWIHSMLLAGFLSRLILRDSLNANRQCKWFLTPFISSCPFCFLMIQGCQMRPSISGVRFTFMRTVGQLQVGSESEALAMPQCSAVDASWVWRSGWSVYSFFNSDFVIFTIWRQKSCELVRQLNFLSRRS